jgi:hypothetical protein
VGLVGQSLCRVQAVTQPLSPSGQQLRRNDDRRCATDRTSIQVLSIQVTMHASSVTRPSVRPVLHVLRFGHSLCSTASRYYLVGRGNGKLSTQCWSICTLHKGGATPGKSRQCIEPLQAHETTSSLSQQECGQLLRQIHVGNQGGLQLVCKVSSVARCAV